MGGGYTGALPLAMEYSPKHKRGLLGGVILSAFPLAYLAISLVGLASFAIFPLTGTGIGLRRVGLAGPVRDRRGAGRGAGPLLRPQRVHSRSGRPRSAARRRATGDGGRGVVRPVAAAGPADRPERPDVPAGLRDDDRVLDDTEPGHPVPADHGAAHVRRADEHPGHAHPADRLRVPGGQLHRVRGARPADRAAAVLRDRGAGDRDGRVGAARVAGVRAGDAVRPRRAAGVRVLDPRHRAVGRDPALHRRALPDRRARLRVRAGLQPVGGDPVVLRVLPRRGSARWSRTRSPRWCCSPSAACSAAPARPPAPRLATSTSPTPDRPGPVCRRARPPVRR